MASAVLHNGTRDLADACRVLALQGYSDFVWGHVAARAEDGRGIWMKPADRGLEEVSERDAILVGWDGEVLSGELPRHAEYPIHTQIMRCRADVNATVHVHTASCVIFASLAKPLRAISHEACYFAPVGVPTFRETSDLILTFELGDAVARALSNAHAAFLTGHGIVTVGTDLVEAVMAAILLDRACRKQLAAMAAGGPAVWASSEEAAAKRDHVYPRPLLEQAWRYLIRRTDALADCAFSASSQELAGG